MKALHRSILLAALWLLSASHAVAGVNNWTLVGDPAMVLLGVAIHPADPATVFVAGGAIGSPTGMIRKSTDGGATWSTIFTSTNHFHTVAVDPQAPATLYAVRYGTESFGAALYKSTDGGTTWNLRNLGLTAEIFQPGFAIDPVNPSNLYVIGRFNSISAPILFRSANGGDSWSTAWTEEVRDIAVDPAAAGTVYAGVANGIIKSVDGGATWAQIRVVPPEVVAARGLNVFLGELAIEPAAPSTLYAAGGSPVLFYKSTDAGITWTSISPRTLGSGAFPSFLQHLVAVVGTPTALFARGGNCDVYKSLDGGASWSRANTGLPQFGHSPGCFVVDALASGAPASPSTIYAISPDLRLRSYQHDASLLTPACALDAAPTVVASGGSATLSTLCSPAATSYVWSANSGLGASDAGGTVFPAMTTTYTVQGVNANGAGPVASVTVRAPDPRLVNISTRANVLTGDDVLIGGFIIGGTTPKTVVVRARGPSLPIPPAVIGVTPTLSDPALQLLRKGQPWEGQIVVATNDNWRSAPNAAAVEASGFAPASDLEPAVLMTLVPGSYTAIVSGSGNNTGIGIVEVFEVDQPLVPLDNISTRARVQGGSDQVVIGGFIIQGNAPKTVAIRARGSSLAAFGVASPLANPLLELYSGSTLVASNDDWADAANATDIQAAGMAPSNTAESVILITLDPGAYTAIVRGTGAGTGVAIVEVFAR